MLAPNKVKIICTIGPTSDSPAPRKGVVAIFNRSHYEDVLVVRVHKLIAEAEWSKRYDLSNDFEQLLVVENHTTILKFFLHMPPEEQLARFKQRLDDPTRNSKISESDYQEREYRDDYTEAYEELLHKTSTQMAAWFIFPFNHKWFRNLPISQNITSTVESLNEILNKSNTIAAKGRPL